MSRYILDTHAVLWWWTDVDRLGAQAQAVLFQGESALFVSAASIWEIAIKQQSGELAFIEDFAQAYRPLMARNRFTSLAISDAHAVRARFLPATHKDPFDRMIAAQALSEELVVITRDPAIAALGCEVLW